MTLNGNRTYVGFGFGAIQAGLFLYEAYQSGHFGRLVAAEIQPEVVSAVRQTGGWIDCNIAHPERIETVRLGPVQVENPAHSADRERLVQAVAEAAEIGTALPSVDFYVSDGADSLRAILAEGLRRKAREQGPPAVIYTAENHNHAAEILQAGVLEAVPAPERDTVRRQVCFLNTVIGKMSGVVTGATPIREQNLRPVTPGQARAFLVEAFNRILISTVHFEPAQPFTRGIDVFQEKADLLPFEEAKLYGHNATHALAAYLALHLHIPYIADLPAQPGILSFLRAAFIEESGAALVKKYAGIDPLFTPAGYAAYADDLLARMTNPLLRDSAARVGRDPERKLGWNDRLIGVIRLALAQGITPRRYTLGVAAALTTALITDPPAIIPQLTALWQADSPPAAEQEAVLALVGEACRQLKEHPGDFFILKTE